MVAHRFTPIERGRRLRNPPLCSIGDRLSISIYYEVTYETDRRGWKFERAEMKAPRCVAPHCSRRLTRRQRRHLMGNITIQMYDTLLYDVDSRSKLYLCICVIKDCARELDNRLWFDMTLEDGVSGGCVVAFEDEVLHLRHCMREEYLDKSYV